MKKIRIDKEEWRHLLKQDKLDSNINIRVQLHLKSWYEKQAKKMNTNSNRLIRKVLETYMEVSKEKDNANQQEDKNEL